MWQDGLRKYFGVRDILVAGVVTGLMVWASDATDQNALFGPLLTYPRLSAAPPSCADDSEVRLTKKDSSVEVTIDGEPFTVFNYGKEKMKPFIFPLYSQNQVNVLREIIPTQDQEQGPDHITGKGHFHHKGVWIAVDSVNDEKWNYWHEGKKITNQTVTILPGDSSAGRLSVTNLWLGDNDPLIKETTEIKFYPIRLITYEIQLAAIDEIVTFYDTKEGFLATRLAHSMRALSGGRIVNADGLKGEEDCWGKPTQWIDYYGEVEGRIAGVTLMDHPNNLRPSRYHVRAYGLFAISPFGERTYSKGKSEAVPLVLEPGQSVRLRYGVYIHSGDTESGKVADTYRKFVASFK